MKKLFVYLVVFMTLLMLSVTNYLTADNITKDSVLRYDISSPSMESILQKISVEANTCKYFSLLDRTFYYRIRFMKFDSASAVSHFSIEIVPSNATQVFLDLFGQAEVFNTGICYYNNHLVTLISQDTTSLGLFFISSGVYEKPLFDNSENVADHFLHTCIHTQVFCSSNGDDISIEEPFETNHCDDKCEFLYFVKPEDTWSTIAKSAGNLNLEKELRHWYEEYERPIPGTIIYFLYLFEEESVRILRIR